MALARQMMGGGLSSGQAKAINGSVATALTATGTTQGTALAINAGTAVFGTVAASTGAILPSCEIGDEVYIWNGGANALKVYPDSGSTLNQLSANTGADLAPNTAILYKRITTTRWIGLMSA